MCLVSSIRESLIGTRCSARASVVFLDESRDYSSKREPGDEPPRPLSDLPTTMLPSADAFVNEIIHEDIWAYSLS